MCNFHERNVSSLYIRGNVPTLQTAHRDFLIVCQIINFLISKQNKAPKIDPKTLKQQGGVTILRRVLSFTQTNKTL